MVAESDGKEPVFKLYPLCLVVAVGSSPICYAGWISEVQPWPRDTLNSTSTQIWTLPSLIELSGLNSLGSVELVVIDATDSPTRHGRILEVVPVADGPSTRVVTESSWPEGYLSVDNTETGLLTLLDENALLDLLDGPRSLMLFDGPTGLIPNSGSIDTYLEDVTATLLDVVTYSPTVAAASFQGEPVLTIQHGQAIARPMKTPNDPWEDLYLVGTPRLNGSLAGTDPEYFLNPGLANDIYTPAPPLPEPGSTVLLLSGVLLVGCSRRPDPNNKHPHHPM